MFDVFKTAGIRLFFNRSSNFPASSSIVGGDDDVISMYFDALSSDI